MLSYGEKSVSISLPKLVAKRLASSPAAAIQQSPVSHEMRHEWRDGLASSPATSIQQNPYFLMECGTRDEKDYHHLLLQPFNKPHSFLWKAAPVTRMSSIISCCSHSTNPTASCGMRRPWWEGLASFPAAAIQQTPQFLVECGTSDENE